MKRGERGKKHGKKNEGARKKKKGEGGKRRE